VVSKLAAAHVKVVLTGDGGDEVFAGYERYLVEEREQSFDKLPQPLRRAAGTVGAMLPAGTRGKRFLQHLGLDGARRYVDASTMFRDDDLRRLLHPDAYHMVATSPAADRAAQSMAAFDQDWLSAVQRWDLAAYLPQDILTKVDRMTMAHSIEARPPLIDHRLVEFAATVPARYRLHNGRTKHLFKQAMRGVLPDHIIDRPKHGFAVPLAQWLRNDLATFARDILLSPTARERGLFDLRHVERLLQLNDRGRNLDLQLWTILSLELWCRRFLDRPSQAQADAPSKSMQPITVAGMR
jgi:asparagine synthase (glutamine-hydrolysing)